MNQSSFAGRFQVGTRIYAGFFLVLALLATLAVTGFLGLRSVSTTFMAYSEVGENAQRVLRIDRNAAGQRRNVNVFATTGDEKAVTRVRELQGFLNADLKKAIEVTRDPGRKTNLERIARLAEDYHGNFDKLIQLRHKREQLVNETMNPLGQKARENLSAIIRGAMQEGFMEQAALAGLVQENLGLVRINALRFLVNPDEKLISTIKQQNAELDKAFAALIEKLANPERKKLAQTTDELSNKYIEAVLNVAAVATETDTLINKTMANEAAEIGDLAKKTVESQAQAMDEMENSANVTIATTESTNFVMAIVAIVLGLVFATFIARSITRPVSEMTGAMGRLAAGDLEVEIPALGNQDEIGSMAKAVQVFKDNAIEKVRMDAAERVRLEDERRQEEAQRQREKAIGQEVATLIDAVSKGDLSRRLDLSDKEGFYRTLSEGINRLTDTVASVITDLAATLGALAQGDLSQRIAKDYQGEFARLKTDFNTTSNKLAEIVGQITQATEAISSAAVQVSSGSADLAERTEQQASSLEETAASMEELSATVRSNADNAQRANQVATEARSAAENGGAVAGSAIEAMKRIEGSSRKIIDIIGVIDEIAFQTNLLALNAAVEAARAGDAGKGFAVVAQEVRVLAQRSAQASKEIKALILDSDAQVRDGVDLVKRAGEALGGIVSGVQQVASLIAEIAGASAEQASGLDEINATVAQMDEMTQKNAALVEETTAASQSMAAQANDLRHLMGFFKVDAATLAAATAAAAAKGHTTSHITTNLAHHTVQHHTTTAAPHRPTTTAHKPVAAKPHAPAPHKPIAKPPIAGKPGVLKRAKETVEDDDWKEF